MMVTARPKCSDFLHGRGRSISGQKWNLRERLTQDRTLPLLRHDHHRTMGDGERHTLSQSGRRRSSSHSKCEQLNPAGRPKGSGLSCFVFASFQPQEQKNLKRFQFSFVVGQIDSYAGVVLCHRPKIVSNRVFFSEEYQLVRRFVH